MPAAAQNESFTPFVADLKDYAELSFALPSEVVVEAESLFEDNYTEGRYVAASLLLNESRVYIFLLYPCQAPETWLNALGVKSAIEGFNAGLNQTIYSPTPLNISDQPAIWGQIGNQILVAYQPSVQTVSIIFIDQNVTESVVEYLLGSLQINVSESSSPLWPGYCGEEVSDVASAEVDSEPRQTEQIVQTDQAEQTGSAPNKEQMEDDLEAVREGLRGLGARL